MTLNILSRLLFLISFAGGLIFIWSLLTSKNHPKLQKYTGIGFGLTALAGFISISENLIILAWYAGAIGLGGLLAYLIQRKHKIITENVLISVRLLIMLCITIGLFIIIMQPESYMLGMAGNLTIPEKIFILIELFLITFTLNTFTLHLAEYKNLIKPRVKPSIANPYLLHAFTLFTLSLILFFFLTESILALTLLIIDCLLYAFLFTHYAPENQRIMLNWMAHITFGASFITLGLLLSNTFGLLIGALFLANTSLKQPEGMNWKEQGKLFKQRFKFK